MNATLIREWDIQFQRGGRGAPKELHTHQEPTSTQPIQLSRVARLMALALRFEQLLRGGEIASYTELARLGRVSCARISQILNLLQLAPDIQEQLLFLTRKGRGRDPIHLARLQPIAATLDWVKQRRLWRELYADAGSPSGEIVRR
jgi:transposase-like protein